MSRKQPTPVPAGAIKPAPPPAPPLRSEPVYGHEGVEIPWPGAAHEIEEALRQLVEALPDLYDEVDEDAMDAIRYAQRVLGIEVEEEETVYVSPPPPEVYVDAERGRDWWWRSGKDHRKPLRTISAAVRRAKPNYVIRVVG